MLFGLLKLGVFTGEVKDFSPSDAHDPNPAKNLEWRPFRRSPNPAFDPTTEKLGPEIITVEPTEIVVSRAIVLLTQPELDGIDKSKIVGAMLDLGFIVIKLVDKLIAKNVIVAADFDTETKQEYLDLKTLVDKLRP